MNFNDIFFRMGNSSLEVGGGAGGPLNPDLGPNGLRVRQAMLEGPPLGAGGILPGLDNADVTRIGRLNLDTLNRLFPNSRLERI